MIECRPDQIDNKQDWINDKSNRGAFIANPKTHRLTSIAKKVL